MSPDYEAYEYVEGRLLDEQDRIDWERQRADDLGYGGFVSRADMREAWAADMRAAHADDLTGEEWRAGSRERLAWIARLADARQREREAAERGAA